MNVRTRPPPHLASPPSLLTLHLCVPHLVQDLKLQRLRQRREHLGVDGGQVRGQQHRRQEALILLVNIIVIALIVLGGADTPSRASRATS